VAHRLITWAWDQVVGDAEAKLALVRLADGAREDGTHWPSLKTLSDDTEIPRRSLQRKIQLLVSAGLLVVEPRYRADGRGRTSNRYRLLAPAELLRVGDDGPPCHGDTSPSATLTPPLVSGRRSPRANGGAGYEPSLIPSGSRDPSARPQARACDGAPTDAEGLATLAERADGLRGSPGELIALPAEILSAATVRCGAAWVASWLEGCGFDPLGRQIIAPTGLKRDRIREAIGRELGALGDEPRELGGERRKQSVRVGDPMPLAAIERALQQGEGG
jgi:hypothetical protein